MNQTVVLYKIELESVKSPYGRTHSEEVKHLYQMLWINDKLIFRYLGRDRLDDRYIFDSQLAWRYGLRLGSDDIVFEAKEIRGLEVYIPKETNQAQWLDLNAAIQKSGLMKEGMVSVEEAFEFFVWPGYSQPFLEMIRQYARSSNLELKESDRLPDAGAGGKALMLITIALWILGLSACTYTPARPGALLLSLLPGAILLLLFILFPNKLVSCSERGAKPVRKFVQVSMLGFAVLPLFPVVYYEILDGLRLYCCALILFVIMAAIFLLRIRVWKVRARYWIVPLAALLLFSFGAIQHVNYALDVENARCVETFINGKQVSASSGRYGRIKNYSLEIEAEGHRFSKSVGEKQYNACEVGDPAEVYFFEGALGIEMAIVNIE